MSQTAGDGPTIPSSSAGLSLQPFRALRPTEDGDALGGLLCPPYDVIDEAAKTALLSANPDNAVGVILPDPSPEGYADAAARLNGWVDSGRFAVDADPALYVYEMSEPGGGVTRGLVGAVELRDPVDGVILPHENTMAGPVADRLEVMTATGADLEPIYLVYDGGGPASALVRQVDGTPPVATTVTPDGISHRLWRVTDPEAIGAVDADLGSRRALIADGHHRYATYRERQRLRHAADGPGPWDRGMALLVDTTDYGPSVHAIHRVIPGLSVDDVAARTQSLGRVVDAPAEATAALGVADGTEGFAVVVTDGSHSLLITDPDGSLAAAAARPGESDALTDLDVTVLHRGLVERAWGLVDDVETVRYAHSVADAVQDARATDGVAVLLRPTPVAAVAAVAAAGARMPRKSTLFTPKPASGLVLRRLADQT